MSGGRMVELFQHGRELIQHRAFKKQPLRTIARAMSWPVRCAFGESATIQFRDPEFLLNVPAKFRSGGGTAAYVLREFYEPEYSLLPRLLNEGMVVVDAGANAGAFSIAAAKLVGPTGRVFAFEPGPACCELLRSSVDLNQLSNVVVRSEALSNRVGEAKLFKHHGKENSFGLGGGELGDVEFVEIKMTTLSEIASEYQFDRIDFMKLDVEGSQEHVIDGGMEIIKTHEPTILIENNIGACHRLGLDPAGAFEKLGALGYRFGAMDKNWFIKNVDCPEQTRSVLCFPNRTSDMLPN